MRWLTFMLACNQTPPSTPIGCRTGPAAPSGCQSKTHGPVTPVKDVIFKYVIFKGAS
jgi:hypothetical protein